VFVGGPDASQKGFGDSSPQNFVLKSAIAHLASFAPRKLRHVNHATIPIIPAQPIARTNDAI
jgi:hypothetical protein